eukprot:CAMPEP_0202468168 /NCGR_PEP_ID=MMETSP1360-20130828/74447_1 /ASSEMBLY_ACC=CAM_ASM_000848 /TAXON_ID=515479 /ORGANISM="Licmophora paradoxa, Strain CCMP2313" /LENGTH=136 /DNA_ID=CAMNT_0049093003 /DNA_START=44 /DNA_END=451 /DNA_ORIENTATION=-
MEGDFHGCIEYALKILDSIGESVPTSNVSMPRAMFSFARVQIMLRNKTDEDWLSLPKCNDAIRTAAMILWGEICTAALLGHKGEMLILATSRHLLMASEYGWTESFPCAFACWGVLQATMGNFHLAYRYARLSVKF